MKKWVEYDPYTGVTETTYASDDDDLLHVTKEQDVEPLLDLNAEVANTKAADGGIKKGLWKYCSIPVVVQYELLKKGINVFNPNDMPRVIQEINQNYPKLKNTHLHHEIGSRKPKNSPNEENSTKPGPSVIVH